MDYNSSFLTSYQCCTPQKYCQLLPNWVCRRVCTVIGSTGECDKSELCQFPLSTFSLLFSLSLWFLFHFFRFSLSLFWSENAQVTAMQIMRDLWISTLLGKPKNFYVVLISIYSYLKCISLFTCKYFIQLWNKPLSSHSALSHTPFVWSLLWLHVSQNISLSHHSIHAGSRGLCHVMCTCRN